MRTRAALSTSDAAFLIRLHSPYLRDNFDSRELGDIIWERLECPSALRRIENNEARTEAMVQDDIREYHVERVERFGHDTRYVIRTRMKEKPRNEWLTGKPRPRRPKKC